MEIPLPLLHTIPAEQALDSAPPDVLIQASANYNVVQQAISKGFYSVVFKKDATTWRQWRSFCRCLHIGPNLKGIEDPVLLLEFFPSASLPDFCPYRGSPSRSGWSSNTSAPWVKSSHPWGTATPATTAWGKSTFGWDRRGDMGLRIKCVP